MKYFTSEWWNLCQNWNGSEDFNPRLVIESYKDHFYGIKKDLPSIFVDFLDLFDIHDGTVLSFEINADKKILSFNIFAYDSDKKERNILIKYHNVRTFKSEADYRNGFENLNGFSDIGYEECYILSDGLVEHRLLLSNGVCFIIQFCDFTYEILGDSFEIN